MKTEYYVEVENRVDPLFFSIMGGERRDRLVKLASEGKLTDEDIENVKLEIEGGLNVIRG